MKKSVKSVKRRIDDGKGRGTGWKPDPNSCHPHV